MKDVKDREILLVLESRLPSLKRPGAAVQTCSMLQCCQIGCLY